MELGDYLRILYKRWRVMALAVLICVGLQAVRTSLADEVYTAKTRVFISSTVGGSASDMVQSSMFVERRIQSYAEVIESQIVLQPVVDSLGLDMSSSGLSHKVTTSVVPETVLIDIRVTDGEPAEAARIANAIAAEFQRVATNLDPEAPDESASVLVTVLNPATDPSDPTSPSWRLNLALAAFIGIVIGLAGVALRDAMDTKVKGQRDVHRITRAPILGQIGYDSDAEAHPLLVQMDPQSRRSESIRQLRTNLQFLSASNSRDVYVVTSSVPGEGKSTVATNLAITMSQAGRTVCIVEADLRRPSLGGYLGLEGSIGLTSVLVGEVELADALQPWGGTRVNALLSGRIPPNPSELLSSAGMQAVVAQLEATHDVVVIDCPPLLPVTDGAILAKLVGGAIIVVGTNIVKRQELEMVLSDLTAIGVDVQGIILNRVPTKGPDAAGHMAYGGKYGSDGVGPWIDPPAEGLSLRPKAKRKAPSTPRKKAAPRARSTSSAPSAVVDDPLIREQTSSSVATADDNGYDDDNRNDDQNRNNDENQHHSNGYHGDH